MLCGIDWVNFFINPENKKDLIKPVCSYFQTDDCRNLFEILLIVSSGENIWSSITKKRLKSSIYQTMKKLTQS